MTVNWANKGDAAGFHIAYGPAQNNLIWGVEVNDGKASQYTLQNLPDGDLWVAVIAKSSTDCGGPSSPVVKVGGEVLGAKVLGAAGTAESSLLFGAGFLLVLLGLWQAQYVLAKKGQKA